MPSEKSLCCPGLWKPTAVLWAQSWCNKVSCAEFQGEACFKIGVMRTAEVIAAPGWQGRAACLLPEVLRAVSKGWHQENSLPCAVTEDIAPEKAGLLSGNNNVKSIIENADVQLHLSQFW